MKVKNIVNDFLINSSPMHKMRRLALVECINALLMAIPLRSRVWGVVLRARPLKSIRSNEVTDCVPTTISTGREHRYMAVSVISRSPQVLVLLSSLTGLI
jgi:hypothetical protein